MSFELNSKGNAKKYAPKKGIANRFVASHSRFIYGKPVETREPYPRYYMSEYYFRMDQL